MSLQAFQSALVRLVADQRFREAVRTRGDAALGPDLTERERRRLKCAATDPGLAATAALADSLRLAKLLQLLPLTRTLLGDTRLLQDARAFWRAYPPRGAHALDEAVAFCDHLLARESRSPLLKDVVSFERALLELRRDRPPGETAPDQDVFFRHDPRTVLPALYAGQRPRQARRWHGHVRATLGANGQVDWSRA